MSPKQFAENLAASDDPKDQALGVAIIARGLSDDEPETHRQGWPLEVAIPQAAKYLGLEPSPELVAQAAILAPKVSDAMLNKASQED